MLNIALPQETHAFGLAPLDWLAILSYIALALGVGAWMSRRASRSTDDFYLAGRTLPWWISGTSLVATSFAADTPLFVAGLVRTDGIAGNWLWWSFVIGGALWFVVLAAWWRRLTITTNAEYIELRYDGTQARALRGFYGAYHALITNTIVLVWVLLAMRKVVGAVLGLEDGSADTWIVAGAVTLALCYSVLAGLWGVVLTDLFQFFLALGGAILLAYAAVQAAGAEVIGDGFGFGENLKAMMGRLNETHPDKLALVPSPGPGGWTSTTFWTKSFTAFIVTITLVGWLNKNADGSPQAVQRFLASKDEGHARGGALWFHIAHYCLRPWPWILVGLASLILLPDEMLMRNGEIDHEASYPILMRQLLGPGVFGLLCASFLAAFMSTLDTHFNSASAYFVNDVYRRFMHKTAEPRHYVRVGRLVAICVGLIAAALSLVADSIKDLFTFSLTLVAGLGPALFLRWLWWRANAWTEIAGLVTSTVLALTMQAIPDDWWGAAPFNGWEAGIPWAFEGRFLLISAVSLPILLAVTLLTKPVDKQHLQKFWAQVRPFGLWKSIRPADAERAPWLALLAGWLGGMGLIFGLMLCLGAWLLDQNPLPYGLMGLFGAIALRWSWPRTVT